MAKKSKSDADVSLDNMSDIAAEPVASNDYEGKQHYPKAKYHKDHDARIVATPEEEAALEDVVAGWQDTPIVVDPPVDAPPPTPDLPGVKA